MKSIPNYAVDLLMAAKFVALPPLGATPEMLHDHLIALNEAVVAFERQMPIVDGTIVVDCPAP